LSGILTDVVINIVAPKENPKKSKKKKKNVEDDESEDKPKKGKKDKKTKKAKKGASEDEEEKPKKKGRKKKNEEELEDDNPELSKIEIKRKKKDDDEENSQPFDGGVKIIALNQTRSVLVCMKLNARNFTEFKCQQPELPIGVNLTSLSKALKALDKDDTLTLYIDDDDTNHLGIRIDSARNNKVINAKLNLMEMEDEPIDFSQADFDSFITMPSVGFQQTCRSMNSVNSEFVEIKSVENQLIFFCKGENGSYEIIFGDDAEGDGVDVENRKDIVQGIYELKHLMTFIKCTQVCNNIEIYMKNNYPLIIKYTVATLGEVYFCLSHISEKHEDKYGDLSDIEESDDEDDNKTKKKKKGGEEIKKKEKKKSKKDETIKKKARTINH
jgi:proliferating cell nuclear antigen